MTKFYFVLFNLFFIITITAQNATLKGKVKDENGEELYAVNVVIDAAKGWATQTDFDGNYTLSVPAGKYYVLFSFIGKKQNIKEVNLVAGETKILHTNMLNTEEEIGIVTVTGGKYEKSFGEEIVSMEVLAPSIIENNVAQAEEALNKVPGYTQLGESPSIRGGSGWSSTTSSRVLFLIDGVPQLSPENGGVFMETLPLENLQQVEVIKGASSALYGSAALNGIINFRTAWPTDTVPFRRITTGIGMYQKFTSNLIKGRNDNENRMQNPNWWWDDYNHMPVFINTTYEHRQRFKHLDVVLGAHYRHDQSFRKDNEYDRFRINGKIRHISKKNPGLNFGTAWNFVYQEGGQFFLQSGLDEDVLLPSNPTDPLFKDVRTDYVDRRISISPFLNYFDKKENKHAIRLRYYNNQSTNFGLESIKTNHVYSEYNFTKDFTAIGLTIITGATASYTSASGKTYTDGDHYAINAGTFIQAEKKFFDKLTLSGGLRIEYNQVDSIKPQNTLGLLSLFKKNGDVKSPVKPLFRFGVNYEVIKGTYLRGGFGQGFRVPTINEYFINTKRGLEVIPNPALLPESGWSAELGVKQGVKVGKWQGFFDVAGFYTFYNDLIDFEPAAGFKIQAQNIDDASIAGFEVSALGQGKLFGYPLQFLVGYSFINPIIRHMSDAKKEARIDIYGEKNYKYLNYRSKHNFKADIEGTVKGFTMGLSGIYVSNMINIPLTRGINGINTFRETHNKGYFLFDARIRYTIKERSNLTFIVKNILNIEYMQRPGIIEAPRNYALQFQHEF